MIGILFNKLHEMSIIIKETEEQKFFFFSKY